MFLHIFMIYNGHRFSWHAAAVLACLLKNGPPKFDESTERHYHASHRYHCKTCVDPECLVFERRADNNRRCVNGSATTCECRAGNCIWKRNGIYLPRRNEIGKAVCDCGLDCFGNSFNFVNNFNHSIFSPSQLDQRLE